MTAGPDPDPERQRDEQQPRAPAPVSPAPVSPAPASAGLVSADPAVPQRSADDSDIGWGGHPDADDDERLREDRPPHWDSP